MKEHKGMVDNKMVHSDRQRGIERVMQKDNEKRVGHHGKLGVDGMGHKGKMHEHGASESHFKRSDKMTPREA